MTGPEGFKTGAMNLKSLLLCSDDKIVRVLRRTLADDISVELCASSEIALRNCAAVRGDHRGLRRAGSGGGAAQRAGRAVQQAGHRGGDSGCPEVGLRSAFEIGAHFILYKPVSVERSKSSFRAARALMRNAAQLAGISKYSGRDDQPRIGYPLQGYITISAKAAWR